MVVVCPDAEQAQGLVDRPLRALADRLFRLNPAWRLDEKGRGLFLRGRGSTSWWWAGRE